MIVNSIYSATTSAFGGNDAQTAIQQLVVLNQALQQRAVELEEAKNEAEQAGAGDTSLDSMSTDDLVEKMAAAPLYAALGREGKPKFLQGLEKTYLFRTSKNCCCCVS